MAHPQYDEVTSFLQALCDTGFKLDEIDDGEDWCSCENDIEVTRIIILGCAESRLRVSYGSSPAEFEILITLGKEPGELAADYTGLEPLMTTMELWRAMMHDQQARAEAEALDEENPPRFLIIFSDDSATEFDAPDLATAWEMAPDIATAHRKAGVLLVRPLEGND